MEDLFSVFDAADKQTKLSLDEKDNDKSTIELVEKVAKRKQTVESTDTDLEKEKKKLKSSIKEELSLLDSIPRIQVHQLDTIGGCTHEVAYPPDVEFEKLKTLSGEPAKEYPFVLDPFQRESVLCLENNQSVLVSAHTSAGKTVVAEYAIAMSLRDKQRVIYTTPIKALSNQKYREFYEEFEDVGLMTGDVTINPTASCLIMTTEILRSMLYRGSEVMREVAWVIFDEIHYMRDKERGVVWEETIILLPDNVHYVFLSATIPNAAQFAEWICHLHKQPCHIVYTDYRPTPLQHYVFPSGGDGIHIVVDEHGKFREDNFNMAMAVLNESADSEKIKSQGMSRKNVQSANSDCYKIVKMIMERDFAPVIVFSFSKKDCESYAMQMSKLDFNKDEEKKLVEEVFNNAINTLSDEDKKLPQVENVLPLLKKGIGIHHSGLLPLLKETIEILFGEGLIKALFATETFAMGLNMPARTVVFTSCRKFDGTQERWLSSGEYIQMSGRAGRRGIDDKGIVILMVDQKLNQAIGKQIIKGQPDFLNSSFHLTYNMVLNLLRVEEINPEYMLERSFFQFQNYASIPGLHKDLLSLEEKYNTVVIPNEDSVASYYKIRQQLDNMGSEVLQYIQKPQYIIPYLQPGRLIKVENGDDKFGWGIVVNYEKKTKRQQGPGDENQFYICHVLLNLSSDSKTVEKISDIKPCRSSERGEMQVVPVLLHLIKAISSVRLYIHQDLKSKDNRKSMLFSLREVEKRFPDDMPLLDPIDDMGIKDSSVKDLIKKIEAFENRMYSHILHKDKSLPELYDLYCKKMEYANQIRSVKTDLKKKRSLLQMDQLKCMKRVLRRMGYCTAEDVIEIKGRTACEISCVDELLVTELLFNGVFNKLTAEQACALVSCFVFQERSNEMPKLSEQLSGPLREMQETARRIAKLSTEAKLEIDEDVYVDSFRPHMMDVVHEWCNGSTFLHICKMTDIFEGSIIRCMRRLEETLRQLVAAAKAIGNIELENKFSDAIQMIKRDIVFAASLYL